MDIEKVLNVPFQFGLVNQKHIAVIEKMLANGHKWDEIGETIGWHAGTAREHYERFAHQKAYSDEVRTEMACALAKGIEILRKYSSPHVWERNDIASFILQAEKHLLSTPKGGSCG